MPAGLPQAVADWDFEMTGGCHTPAGRLNTALAAVSQVATHARTDANRTLKRVRNLNFQADNPRKNQSRTIVTALIFVKFGIIGTNRTTRAI